MNEQQPQAGLPIHFPPTVFCLSGNWYRNFRLVFCLLLYQYGLTKIVSLTVLVLLQYSETVPDSGIPNTVCAGAVLDRRV